MKAPVCAPMGLLAVILLYALVAATLATVTGINSTCRQDPRAKSDFCGLPYKASNFQGYFACDAAVKVGRPTSRAELLALIQGYPRVKGVGMGHSWWQQAFCAGDDRSAIQVVLTEFPATRAANVAAALFWSKPNSTVPADFPIQVDESALVAAVEGGVSMRVLLDYLAKHRTLAAPQGYTLRTFPWYVDQTVAGAVATGSHGSDLREGSLSDQVTELEVTIANGTVITVTPRSNPHLFKALMVSVGRLGIITRVSLRLVANLPVRRTLTQLPFSMFAAQVLDVQAAYNAATTPAAKAAALEPLRQTQVFVWYNSGQIWRTDYEHISLGGLITESMSSTTELEGAYNQTSSLPQPADPLLTLNGTLWDTVLQPVFVPMVASGLYSARRAFVTQIDVASKVMADLDPYDQYETSFPMEVAGTCLQQLLTALDTQNLRAGLRIPGLIRFGSATDAYIGNTNGGPRMYWNLEDHLSHSTGERNVPFEAFYKMMLAPPCSGRAHWGKAGQPWADPCFDGAAHYPRWCDFGCAVQELDPGGKFRSLSDVWQWRATRGGADVPLASCCTPSGFDAAACACAGRVGCADQPDDSLNRQKGGSWENLLRMNG